MERTEVIAYFSMEVALAPGMPTYSGGLGVLAGDTVRTAADMQIPMVAVTLLPRKGYFRQKLDPQGRQLEEPENWRVEDFMQEQRQRVSVQIEGRDVLLRAWKYDVQGITGFKVPVLFLDADLPENMASDRRLSHYLYGGDSKYRLCQEVLLGVGGVRILRSLGYDNIKRFHMNEGHAGLLTLELLNEMLQSKKSSSHSLLDAVKKMCVFTTHTPMAAGHDKFPVELVRQVLGKYSPLKMQRQICPDSDILNMTCLALNLSHYVNGVSKAHGRTSAEMFDHYVIDSITNGVHAATWTSEPFRKLFDRHIPDWHHDNFSLRYALSVSDDELWQAHMQCKTRLIEYVNQQFDSGMDPTVLTIGFARRATAYKRADLLFADIERLKSIAAASPGLQLVFAGKAHPMDQQGKRLIRKVFNAAEQLKPAIKLVYLPDYDIELAKIIIPGVDLWLNTPEPPHEASGTSGMKAALNAVPSLSVLDGWWVEGCVEGLTGWAIGNPPDSRGKKRSKNKDAMSLYDKLENVIVPMFYNNRQQYIRVMLHALALNGSFFNTQRMLQEYLRKAYFL